MTSHKKHVLIAPSLLSADFGRLAEEIRDIEQAGADVLHLDVMDGHFVPNLTIGPPVIKSLRKITALPLDVHLMIEEPARYVDDFRKAGADWITVHVEATQNVEQTIESLKRLGVKAGMSLRPGTPVFRLEPYLPELDLILVMTVEPGFGGQSFMPEQLEKVKTLRPVFAGLISVDGGVNVQTAPSCIDAGADLLVAGTAVFGQKDRKKAIQDLRNGMN